ncbi:MAG: BlaI/MecI/CopY family transcriptional regulator [Chloroflexota bacterium]
MDKENIIQAYRLDEKGLAHIFGELEAKIMEAIWQLEKASVQEIIDHLSGNQHYKTVMTVMNRLVTKGILTRQRSGKAYLYEATETRDMMLSNVVDRMMRGLLVDFRELTITQIVETMEDVDPSALKKLEDLINHRRQAGGEDASHE